MTTQRLSVWILTLLSLAAAKNALADPAPATEDWNIEDLVNMPIPPASQREQIKKKMLNVKVSSVSKASQPLSNAAAAVFVIDNEAIKRSGVTSVPEALRLAPGIDVARINNSKWAVTARGFNGRFANKLLVLIDGRSVYTPDYSGVYWDAQDIMLEDVDRIEVIRGPGATLWGANAMNGVINIITKHTEDTQGTLVNVGGGSHETGFGSVRYGTKLADETYARAYAKGFRRDEFAPYQANNFNADWSQYQGGFRVDSTLSPQDNLMVQANAFKGEPSQTLETFKSNIPFYDAVQTSGWNLTSRFNHSISSTADYSVQFYYDHNQHHEYSINTLRDTLDLDFQNSFALGGQQNVIWGLGYRYTEDNFKDRPLTVFTPSSRNAQLFSAFAQDEISFWDDALLLTIGSKFEHNDYTGFEIQPSISFIWTPVSGHKIWGSISRAVRTPSRADHHSDFFVYEEPAGTNANPLPYNINVSIKGSPAFKAEQQISYQLGYRLAFNNGLSWDISAFYNNYDSLRAVNFGEKELENNNIDIPLIINNASNGNTYGFETSTVWQMYDWWRWDLNYSLLETKITHVEEYQPAVSPEHMVSLRASINPIEKVNVDLWFRHASSALTVNPLGSSRARINGYFTLDARMAWQPINNLELSITGQNLLESQHYEYRDESYALPTGIPRSVYGKISWKF